MQSLKQNALPQNPRERANPFSNLCFCYTMPVFFEGRKKTLTSENLYRALDEHRSETLCQKLCLAWEKQLLKCSNTKKNPSLLTATVRAFGAHFALLGLVLFLLEVVLRVIQPLFLGGLVSYYSIAHSTGDLTTAYLYAVGVVACSALNVMFMHPYMLGTMHVGMKMRVAMCGMIYRKALRLSKNALGETTAGQVVNLISNDVGRLDLATIFIHYLWIGPVETAVITYLMYREIGLASVFGVAFMLMFIPLQAWLGKRTSVLRLRTAIRTDERVRLMNEIIQGIQVIKMYAWEIPFEKMVAYARKKEISTIRYVSYIRGILLSFILFLTRVSVFMSLVGYVLLGQVLTSEKAFVITAYYNILRTTMTVFFPQGIGQLAETLVSIKRIQNYMQYAEAEIIHKPIKENNVITQQPLKKDNDGEEATENMIFKSMREGNAVFSEPGIIFSDFNAKWNLSMQEWTLYNINLRVQPGTLLAIIGPVGAGKSSLIQAILGELKADSGTVEINGSLSYVSQEPWLFNGTVRQNILFGQEMDKKRYRTVVKKCALERDFELFPYGDKTLVGERGTSLSGGQKARISLARAVYRKASIYLLDDPLSAVDSHVARHLFEKCMREYLRDSIVILVTHQLQFLQHADQIIIMDHGSISAVGAYDSLRESGLDFAKLLAEPENQENSDTPKKFGSCNRLHQRHNSEVSIISTADSQFDDVPIQQQEHQEQGKIGLKLYGHYFRASGGFFYISCVIIFCLAAQALASMGDYFLSYWVNKNNEAREVAAFNKSEKNVLSENFNDNFFNNETLEDFANNKTEYIQNTESLTDKNLLDIYIFTAITIATVVVTTIRSFIFFNVAMRSSTKLHNDMFRGVTRATMYFFNINPSGRILNRFSKDMGQLDEVLPSVMMDVIQIFLSLLGIVVVLAVVNPLFLVPTAVLGLIFYYIRSFYLKTSRDVKRVEAITRSPIYSHLAASLTGLATIRSYGAEDILISEFDNLQDMHSSAFYMFISTSRAFGYWLDCFCVLYIAVITLSFFLFPPKNGGDVGLAITQAMGMTGMVQWGMRQSAELENNMTAVERVIEYNNIDSEGKLESEPEKKPPPDWPTKGKIAFQGLSLRYFPDPNSAKILKSLNFEINPYEKIGIVGRTGAGKSSLINALFRLSYNEGSIIIDGRDINQLGLHDLRRKLSIIPQEPVLFSGTMRYNLDPFEEYPDIKVWKSLEEVKLHQLVSDLPNGLHSKISEGGSNFSVGQRQLVCLARAILRENKILVMDEATANVDPQTDALLQSTIRNKFENCTILTIAHRLHTVMDYDKILVMDAGEVVEYGPPYELLSESDTKIFYGMVQQTGKVTYENLLKIAQKSYEQKRNLE